MSTANKSPSIVRRASTAPSAIKRSEVSPQHSLALELPVTAAKTPTRATPVERLWLCIYLPALPLEALGSSEDDEMSRAVFEDRDGIRKVLLANPHATAAGITAGLSVNAALALLPTLELEPRDVQCEQRTLLNLAGWAEQFTSFVAIDAPAVLLLELAGSLRLFGGLQELRQTIARDLGKQGFTAALAIAPTPLSATWLAKAGRRVCIQDMANLTGAVSALPLICLGWPEPVYDSLYGMGITGIGDCLRLPRSGFVKRFGSGCLLELDRAVGRLPDPRVSYRTPESFSAEHEFTEELSDSELILNVCQGLLQRLEQFLLTRQLAVQRITFSFFYLQYPATYLPLGCVQPDRAVKHWFELLRIRFERLQLLAPIIAVCLRAGPGQVLFADMDMLPFYKNNKQDKQRQSRSIEHLVERLGARIGDESVHGVTTVAEHRPHYAWRRERLLNDLPHCETLAVRRPLWMLTYPEPLSTRDRQPVYQGVLQLTEGPERLETGWWDEGGIARDYFVAVNLKGVHLWIYRNRTKDGGWYLHGIFG